MPKYSPGGGRPDHGCRARAVGIPAGRLRQDAGINPAAMQEAREAMTHAVALESLYSYRTLTESEIDRYIAFAESDAGKRYHLVTYNGLHYAIVQAAKKMGTRMGLRLKNI